MSYQSRTARKTSGVRMGYVEEDDLNPEGFAARAIEQLYGQDEVSAPVSKLAALSPAVRAARDALSLTRREADVALHLVRPKDASYVVRRIGRMHFGLYASNDYVHLQRPAEWEFIAFDAQFDEMPQQQWLLGLAL